MVRCQGFRSSRTSCAREFSRSSTLRPRRKIRELGGGLNVLNRAGRLCGDRSHSSLDGVPGDLVVSLACAPASEIEPRAAALTAPAVPVRGSRRRHAPVTSTRSGCPSHGARR